MLTGFIEISFFLKVIYQLKWETLMIIKMIVKNEILISLEEEQSSDQMY